MQRMRLRLALASLWLSARRVRWAALRAMAMRQKRVATPSRLQRPPAKGKGTAQTMLLKLGKLLTAQRCGDTRTTTGHWLLAVRAVRAGELRLLLGMMLSRVLSMMASRRKGLLLRARTPKLPPRMRARQQVQGPALAP